MNRKILASARSCGLAALILSGGLIAWGSPAPQGNQSPNVDAATFTYTSGKFNINAYVAKPKAEGKHPAVLIAHDNQGLGDYARETAQMFAAEGFIALVPDLLSRSGGTKPERAAEMIRQSVPNDTVTDLKAGLEYLQKSPDVDSSKISIVGFGWGGWRSFTLATTTPGLYRGVIYSGATPTEGLQNITIPILGNYGQFDFQNAGNTIWTSNTMKQLGKKYTSHVYPKVQSGFYNPKSRQYDAEAAKIAWTRTLEFLKS